MYPVCESVLTVNSQEEKRKFNFETKYGTFLKKYKFKGLVDTYGIS
jgi:hypothetical protein